MDSERNEKIVFPEFCDYGIMAADVIQAPVCRRLKEGRTEAKPYASRGGNMAGAQINCRHLVRRIRREL